MFYILPYQHDPEASQAVPGTETDNLIEGSSTTQQVTTNIPASLSFIIQPIQVQQNNIELYKDHEISEVRLVKSPEQTVKITNTSSTSIPAKQAPSTLDTSAKDTPSTSSIPAKKPKIEENTKKPKIKGCRCGMCWKTFPNCDQLEVHTCPNATDTCRCTLCLAAKKVQKGQKKYKCCSMCSTYYKCVHFLKKHVDKYHGSCTCRVCKTKFKTRTQCCKHLCRGPRDESKRDDSLNSDSESDSDADTDLDSDSDASERQLEDIEIDNTNTSTNEVLPENDIEIEYIIQSERPDSPPVTFTSIQRKEDYHKISNSSGIALETPVLIDTQNNAYLANEVNIKKGPIEDLNINDNHSKNNLKQQNDLPNLNENHLKSGNSVHNELLNVRSYEIQQQIKDKTDITIAVSDDIETVKRMIVTNDGFKTNPANPNGTDVVIIKNIDDNATKTNNLITYSDNNETEIDSITILDSDHESITSETELDLIEENKITNKIMEISESTDNINDEEIYRKSRSNILHGNLELKTPHTFRSNIDAGKEMKNTTLRKYACNVCKKYFRNESDLLLHNKDHELERDLNISDAGLEMCNYCNMSLNKSDLHDHILFYHHQSEDIVKVEDDISEHKEIDTTNDFLKLEDNISEHQECDTTNDFQCSICTKVYHDKWVLKYHIEQEHKTVTDNSVKANHIQPIIIKESYLDFKDF